EITLGRGPAFAFTRAGRSGASLTIPDARVSSTHARIVRRGAGFRIEDLGSKNGTFLGGERVTTRDLEDGDVLEIGTTFFLFRASIVRGDDEPLDRSTADLSARCPLLVSLLPSLAATFRLVEKIAPSEVPVLVRGETGTGKEVVARAVHELSGR